MRLINKRNVLSTICITYTFVSISLTTFEIFDKGEMNPTQLNIFLFLILSILGVAVLSQHYRFDRFSPLVMIVVQYMLAILMIMFSLWFASFFVTIHPNGYRDMTISFSIPYFIGTIIYYIFLKTEVRKQNALLKKMKGKRNLSE